MGNICASGTKATTGDIPQGITAKKPNTPTGDLVSLILPHSNHTFQSHIEATLQITKTLLRGLHHMVISP